MKLKVTKETIGDPDTPKTSKGTITKEVVSQRTKGPQADSLDIRDALNNFVGTGTRDFRNEDRLKDYHYIRGILGDQATQKLMNHVFTFNGRSDLAGKSPDQRVQAFYDLGSNDPSVDKLIQGYKSLGTGPLGGFRSTGDMTSQQLTGRLPLGGAALAVSR